jgi:hypothetical protein
MAHLVSRNAGYLMSDLARQIERGTDPALAEAMRKLFLLLERANWLIFHDAWHHLLHHLTGRPLSSESPRLLPRETYARFPRKGALADISIMFSSQMTMQIVRCRIPALAAAGLPNSSRKVPCRPSWN